MDSTRMSLMNPWWLDPARYVDDRAFQLLFASPVYFQNPLLDELKLDGRPFYIIRGPRQVGKTTFLRLLIRKQIIEKTFLPKNILFLSCESLNRFSNVIDAVEPWLAPLRGAKTLVVLDEVSFVPEWQRAVLHLDNTGLLAETTLFITGSNARPKAVGGKIPRTAPWRKRSPILPALTVPTCWVTSI